MSMIVKWDSPLETGFFEISCVTLLRKTPASQLSIALDDDAPLGIYEDTENNDPTVEYSIVGTYGTQNIGINNEQIRRYLRTPFMCKIEFDFSRMTGEPWVNRRIEIVSPSESTALYTNRRGYAVAYLLYGTRVKIALEGESYKYDLVIPRILEVKFPTLAAMASKLPRDPRGFF